MGSYAILGIHGEDVTTVNGNVARVRLFLDTQKEPVDIDIDLPVLMSQLPPVLEVYDCLLKPEIEKRIAELEGK